MDDVKVKVQLDILRAVANDLVGVSKCTHPVGASACDDLQKRILEAVDAIEQEI